MVSEDEDDTLAKLVPPPKAKGFLETVQEGAFAALDRMTKKKPDALVKKKPLSPHLEKNKYHDALLDAVADFAVNVGAPMDIVVELHADPKVKGYVVRLARSVGDKLRAVTFRLGVEDVVQQDPAKLEALTISALQELTGKEYVKKPKPFSFLGQPHPMPFGGYQPQGVGPRGKPPSGGSNVSHPYNCVCAKCQQKAKAIEAGPVAADALHPDVPLARRPIDPTKVLDLGDRVMDLE